MAAHYRVFETKIFCEDLAAIQPPDLSRKLAEKLTSYVYPQLAHQPQYGPNIKKLVQVRPETWRYALGAWRLFYAIDERGRVVSLLTNTQRKIAYRRHARQGIAGKGDVLK